jgi:hypothetical protein
MHLNHVGYIIIVVLSGFNATSNWSLRCGDGEALLWNCNCYKFYWTSTRIDWAPNLVAGNVTINYFNNTNSTYQMLWGAGTGVYGTAGIYCNPSTNTFYTNGDIVAFAASDRRLKDNITPIPNALDKILKLVVIHLIGMINKMYILVKILVL